MLPRDKRVTDNKDFQKIFRKGRRASSLSFGLSVLSNRGGVSRLGIIVGKKFSKKAVERNRAKRIIREAIKNLYSQINPSLDIIISLKNVRKNDLKLTAVEQELKVLFLKSGVIKK